MKRIIAIMLAVVLVAGGLGGFAYALDTVNEVQVGFHVDWSYKSPGDTFTQGDEKVTGERKWFATIIESGQLVTGANLTLSSDLPLGWFHPEPETMVSPYQWSFGDVSWAKAGVGFAGPDPSPVNFFPGFDASRVIVDNKTVFLQSEETQTQTVEIKVTPRDSTDIDIRVMVPPMVPADDVVNAVIISPTTDETNGIWLSPGGDDLQIRPNNLAIGQEWSVTVTIDVTPLVPKVKFEPNVEVHLPGPGPGGSGEEIGSSSFSYEVPELGTWTWSTTGTYDWSCQEGIVRTVNWHPSSREIAIPHEPMTGQKLVGQGVYAEWTYPDGTDAKVETGFMLTNPDGVSEITIERISVFAYDGTVVYEGSLRVKVADDEWGVYIGPLKPHETLQTGLEYYDLPELTQELEMWYTVEIFWSGAKDGLPLTGWAGTVQVKRDAGNGEVVDVHLGSMQMLNMEQVLMPEKEKKVTTLRLQTWHQPDAPFMVPLENFAQAVADGTNGSVQVELYPGNALVPNRELAEAVKQGEIEMGLINSQLLRDYSRVMDAGWLPFLYNDEDGLMDAVQAGIGDLMSQELTGHNITALTWTTMAFSHLYNRRVMADDQVVLDHPIIHPDDLTVDVKIRVIGGMGGAHEGIQWEAITEWGGTPVTLAFAEIYELLETEKIHGAMHSPYLYEVMKFYEVAPYFCVDYAFATLAGLSINSDVWNGLDKKTKDIITQAAQDFAVEMLETVKQVDEAALATIEGYGVEVYELNDSQRAIWRQASLSVWDAWVEVVGDVGYQIIEIALTHNPLPPPPEPSP